ncbi:MAG TPA: hemerythrin domain-containing protein [Oxalicibacterium sp.]|nr:hemerythrin domain-containing protein [Oxalicibacterium sp.]
MNLEKYRHQHSDILKSIQALRELSRLGIAEKAAEIAQCVISMSSVIKLHLSVEDRYLYPELQKSSNRRLASMGAQYQSEMQKIASAYIGFAAKWNEASKLARDPEGFRSEANRVLKVLFERIRRENQDFYPAIERS